MSNRSGPFRRAVFAVLLLLGASAVAGSPAASPGRREAGLFERVELAVSGWLERLPFGTLFGVRGASGTSPTDPPAEPAPTSSTEPAEPINGEPANDGLPHWDPNG